MYARLRLSTGLRLATAVTACDRSGPADAPASAPADRTPAAPTPSAPAPGTASEPGTVTLTRDNTRACVQALTHLEAAVKADASIGDPAINISEEDTPQYAARLASNRTMRGAIEAAGPSTGAFAAVGETLLSAMVAQAAVDAGTSKSVPDGIDRGGGIRQAAPDRTARTHVGRCRLIGTNAPHAARRDASPRAVRRVEPDPSGGTRAGKRPIVGLPPVRSLTMRAIHEAREAALARIRRGDPVLLVLDDLARAADRAAGDGTAASILALDRQGRLRSAAGPRLPDHYTRAVDGIRPDAQVGTCAAAAATGEEVVTPNFMECGKWRELRHLPLAIGFVGAWSRPIVSRVDGRVLGTFGTYFRDIRIPTEDERAIVRELAAVAAEALEQRSIDEELDADVATHDLAVPGA